MTKNKIEWNSPKLSILTRSKPEEAVLTSCKISGYNVSPGIDKNACLEKAGKKCEGNPCYAQGAS